MWYRGGKRCAALALAAWVGLGTGLAGAADYGAKVASGDWNNTGTWTITGVPGAGDSVFIGSSSPAGALLTATVSLTQNEAATNVYVGHHNSGGTGTLNLGSHSLTTTNLHVGWYGAGSVGTITRTTGSLSASDLYLGNGNALTLGTGDVITNAYVDGSGSTLTTAAVGNITNRATVYNGSTLTMGANLSVTNSIDVRTGGTVDMQGHDISANNIFLGWYDGGTYTLANRGNLTANTLYVANKDFDLNAGDTVSTFNLSNADTSFLAAQSVHILSLTNGATATTAAVGNITNRATVSSGSTLTMGTNLSVPYSIDVRTGGTVDMQGHDISSYQIFLGWYGGGTYTLANRGKLTANTLYVANKDFDYNAADVSANLSVFGVTATTYAVGNITNGVAIYQSGTLKLGADLNLSGHIDVTNGGTLDAQGHDITAYDTRIGFNGGSAANLTNAAGLDLNRLFVGHGSSITLPGLDETINSLLRIEGASTVLIDQADGVLTGLTLNGTTAGALDIRDTSVLDLQFGLGVGTDWIFRWLNPTGGSNWISTLNSLIGAGRITVGTPGGLAYSVVDTGGYTYIRYENNNPPPAVPEPSSLALAGIGMGLATLCGLRRRRRALV